MACDGGGFGGMSKPLVVFIASWNCPVILLLRLAASVGDVLPLTDNSNELMLSKARRCSISFARLLSASLSTRSSERRLLVSRSSAITSSGSSCRISLSSGHKFPWNLPNSRRVAGRQHQFSNIWLGASLKSAAVDAPWKRANLVFATMSWIPWPSSWNSRTTCS